LPRRLTLPFNLEEGRVPGVSSWLLYVATGFIVACVIWASITEIRELAVASGQLEPAGSVQVVQHLEGGIVSEILVQEGQIVESGAPLVRLQPTAANSDLAQLSVRAAGLKLSIERHTAALDGRMPEFGDLGSRFPGLAEDQRQAFEAEREQQSQSKDAMIARVEQKLAEVQALHSESESLERQLAIDQEQLDIRKKLRKQGFASKATVLEAQRGYERTNSDLISVRGRLQSAQEALNEARIKLLEADAEFNNRMTEERTRASAEMAELRESIAKQEDRVTRLLVRAPAKGIVQELVPKAVGQVLQPGELVARVVPMGEELVAEVQIQPKDIGHVSIGDPANIKITTFDAARFGAISGTVKKISASTFQTPEGNPYYKAIIELDRNFVQSAGRRHTVLPGMVVNAEIVTGSKSLTRYLLKPVYRSLDIAFTER
jgi:HlyD family secretion protein/adhesin transport system membrane fusion protein